MARMEMVYKLDEFKQASQTVKTISMPLDVSKTLSQK